MSGAPGLGAPAPPFVVRDAGTVLLALRRFTADLLLRRRGLLLTILLAAVAIGTAATGVVSSREASNSKKSLPPTKPVTRRQIQTAVADAEKEDGEKPPPSPLAKRAAQRAKKKTFSARLKAILRVCFPAAGCKESINGALLCLMLLTRTVLSIGVAITMGNVGGAIVSSDWAGFLRYIRRFALIGIPASLCNSGIKYQSAILSLRFQRRLTDKLNTQYVTGVNFYKATELPEFKIDNIDSRVTTDVEAFCEQGTEMFCKIFKPILDVLLNTWQLGRDVGARGPAIIIGYFALAVALKIAIMPDFKSMVKKRSELSGNYRTAHSRLITNAEEIAFYEGGARERSIIRQRFDALYWHARQIATKTAAVAVVDTWIEKYGASIAGFFIMCLPIFFSSRQQTVAQNTNDFIKRRAIMTDLANGLGSLLIVGTQLKMLSGTIARVAEVFESVKQLNETGTSRFEIRDDDTTADAASSSSTTASSSSGGGCGGGGGGGGRTAASEGRPIPKSQSMLVMTEVQFLDEWRERGEELHRRGKAHGAAAVAAGGGVSMSPRDKKTVGGGKVVEGPTIRFEKVELVSPDGRHLVQKPLDFEIPRACNVMVTGPNGCGKSSLFRVLGELWPPYSGVVTKPSKSNIIYLVMGSLRDQIIYPDNTATMAAKGVTDEDLRALLALVDPPGTILARWDFDHEMNWSLTLSGGQKQRVAMARMFYRLPAYAILDECTSAMSDDITDKIYETCASLGITLFTIAHQRTVLKHHQLVLRFDGKGGWTLQEEDILAPLPPTCGGRAT